MKKRNGFVSNSSSCSFVVSLKEFPTTVCLADFMIVVRYEYKKDYYKRAIESIKSDPDRYPNETVESCTELLEENEETYAKLRNNLSEITDISPNVAFKSFNFDTFIREIEVDGQKYLYVATCHNVVWDMPKVIPQGKSKTMQEYFNDGDLHDGLWNEEYIQGETFIVVDTGESVTIKDRFKELRQ